MQLDNDGLMNLLTLILIFITNKPGRNNTDADALRRFPQDIKEYNKTYTNEVFSAVTDEIKRQECWNEAWLCAVNSNSNLLKEHEDQVLHQSTQTLKTVSIKHHQDDDQTIKRVKEIILNNEHILVKDKVKEEPPVQRLLQEHKKLKLNSNNILVQSTEKIDQIVKPPSQKWLIYQEFHKKIAHLGAERSDHLAKSRVYYPNMEKVITFFINKECPCLASKKQHITAHAPLGTVTSTSPMDIIAVDFLKVDRAAGGYECILVIIDQFMRYAQAHATTNKSAKTAAEKLFNDFVLKFGTPNRILHDQGKEFENKLFDELEKHFEIKRCRTTSYHSMCNGIVERLNSTVIQMLRTLSEKLKWKWKDSLNKLMYAYNCTKHTITGYSPYFLLFGRNPKLPIVIILREHQEPTNEQPNYHNFIQRWKVRMKEAFKIAEENIKKRRSADKRQRDLKATLEPLQVGGRVLVRNFTERWGPGKILSFWEQKIYRIKKRKTKTD